MRYSQLYGNTRKEIPKDAEIISHQLMIKAGLIKKLSSGLYTWMPLGLKVLNKISNIIRAEMENIGFSEIQMPVVQPAKFWQETGRWDKYGPLLLKIKDRHDKDYCFGPTHEEIVTDVIRQDLSTYKNLPIKVFQIHTKFRDEIRPRYGVMRSREFLMKDGYSFNEDNESLKDTYADIKQAYHNMFKKMGLDVRAVLADNGDIGGDSSHEFHVLANSGEDSICFSTESDFAANVELCPVIDRNLEDESELKELTKINHKGSIQAGKNLPTSINKQDILSSYLVMGNKEPVLIILGSLHELNSVKAEKHPDIASPLVIYSKDKVKNEQNIDLDYLGPVESKFKVIADSSLKHRKNLVSGANQNEHYYTNINWQRDTTVEFYDLRNVEDGDLSPDGKGTLKIKKGIEIGHIFQLQDTYTKSMNVTYTAQDGHNDTPVMGCYGIGVGRIVAAAIEQSHDSNGIIWPEEISPYNIVIIPIDYHKSTEINNISNSLYEKLKSKYDVLLDDRDNNPGSKFKDADLIGIPHRIVISKKLLTNNQLEYKHREEDDVELIPISDIETFLLDKALINNN